ncbi:MAG: rRNA maturation RNase YbeY [Chloroflexota bacterium]
MAENNIQVSVGRPFRKLVAADRLISIVERTLAAEGILQPVELSLVVTGQRQVQRLNREYRSVDEPTDVLAFALGGPHGGQRFVLPPDGVLRLGELAISYPQAVSQAAEQGHSVTREVALLVVHGVLHLLGYDHIQPGDRARMRTREQAVLGLLFPEGG